MLTVRDLCVTYPDGVRALHGVSLDVPKGTVFGLLGPNGAGKSTLLRVLATLQLPQNGTVHVCDVDALASPDHARRHLGYLPQDFGFPAALTAAELLDHFAVLKGILPTSQRRVAVAEMLARVNLVPDQHRALRTFSGGMKQRLGIAIALLGAPDVLIVDEPTTALDPTERHRVHDLLLELAESRAVLLSTHLVSDVDALCDMAMILHRGHVVSVGVPSTLVAALRGRLFRARVSRAIANQLRQELPVIREALVSGAVEVTVVSDAPPDARFLAAEPLLDDVFAEATLS
jgi:ABC-2 type transport system ATP-binding protein